MKHTKAPKTARQTHSDTNQDSSARRNSISITPPAYGLDFVDGGYAATATSSPPVQRQPDLEEEELPQGKFATHAAPVQSQSTTAPAENRAGIPGSLKAELEQLSGLDMSGVRVNYNSSKPAQLGALAYTQGQNIEVGPRQERHLPHEAWHVVQQMQGRVKPTTQVNGVPINDDPMLESEADMMGAKVVLSPKSPDGLSAAQAKFATNETESKGLAESDAKMDGGFHRIPLQMFRKAMEHRFDSPEHVHDANPVVQMFLKELFGGAQAKMLVVEGIGHVLAGLAAITLAGIGLASGVGTLPGVMTGLVGLCQIFIGVSKFYRSWLMKNHGQDPGAKQKLGKLISFEAFLWSVSSVAAAIANPAAWVWALVSGIGSIVKFIRGILTYFKAPKWLLGILIAVETIFGLIGSIAGIVAKGIVKGLAALFGALVNAIKLLRGSTTAEEGFDET